MRAVRRRKVHVVAAGLVMGLLAGMALPHLDGATAGTPSPAGMDTTVPATDEPVPTTEVTETPGVATDDTTVETTVVETTVETTVAAPVDTSAPPTTTDAPETTAPGAAASESTVIVGPAAPGDPYDVTVAAVCDGGTTPFVDVTNTGTGAIRVSVGPASIDPLGPGQFWRAPWPMTIDRETGEESPDGTAKWDAVQLDGSDAIFDSGTLALPPDCPPLPDVPSAPESITSTAGNGSVSLQWLAPSWNGGSPLTDYTIEYRRHDVEEWTLLVDSVGTTTSAVVTGLTNGITYRFQIIALNANGPGEPGEAKDMPATVPSAPRSLTAVPTNVSGGVRLTWLAPLTNGGLPVTDYIIQRSPNGTNTWTTITDGVNVATAYTVSGLTNGTRYYFRVFAKSAVGISPPSNVASRTAPTAPRSLTATATGASGQIRLAWLAPLSNGGSAITDYIVQRSPNGTNTWTTIPDGVNVATAYTVTGLTNGTRYYFRVFAKNVVGLSPASNVANGIPKNVLTAPRSLTAAPTNRSGQVRLSWTAPLSNGGSAITDYIIRRSPNGSTGWVTIADGVNVNTAYSVTGLSNGVRYYFRVYARTVRGTSPSSNLVSAIPRTVPSAPRTPTAAPTNISGQIRVTWVAPASNGGSAVTDYAIQRSPNGTTSWVTITDGVNVSTAYTVTGLTNGVRYYFRVFAKNAAGLSPTSTTVSAIPRTVPGPVPSFAVTSDEDGFYLVWGTPATGGSPITSFTIQAFDFDTDTWFTFNPVPPDWRGAFIEAPGEGCGTFRMAAVNAAGRGPFTAAVESCWP